MFMFSMFAIKSCNFRKVWNLGIVLRRVLSRAGLHAAEWTKRIISFICIKKRKGSVLRGEVNWKFKYQRKNLQSIYTKLTFQ